MRAEQVTQLVLGETAAVLERPASGAASAADCDGYEGWVHAGYLLEVDDAAAEAWRRGRRLERRRRSCGSAARQLVPAAPGPGGPLDGDDGVRLPDGPQGPRGERHASRADRRGRRRRAPRRRRAGRSSISGRAVPVGWRHPVGRGLLRPGADDLRGPGRRAAARLVAAGAAAPPFRSTRSSPGDLLFFRERDRRPASRTWRSPATDDTLIHSTIACGGVVASRGCPATRAAGLRERLVAVGGSSESVNAKLVLFDIDGTILLTAGAGRRAIIAALGEEVGDPAGFGRQIRFDGKTDPQIVPRCSMPRGTGPHAEDGCTTLCRRYVTLLERSCASDDAHHAHAGRPRAARPARSGGRRGARPADRQTSPRAPR